MQSWVLHQLEVHKVASAHPQALAYIKFGQILDTVALPDA